MIVYQVKVLVQPQIEKEWLAWMKQTHVPDLLATGLVVSSKILRSLDDPHTYYFHYYFKSQADYRHYVQHHAPRLQAHPLELFGGKFEAGRKLMEMI